MTNIVSIVSRFLTPHVVDTIASASGLMDHSIAQKAVKAVVPTILGGLANRAVQPGGARQIADAVAGQSFDLGNIASSLTSPTQTAEQGSSLLSSLLGAGALNVLAPTIGKFLGIGEGPIRTTMGLLTPVILEVLGREQQVAGLDANGLARMLAEQKDDFADAMPSGLSSLIQATGLFGPSASPARRPVETPLGAYNLPRAVSTEGGVGWVYWVLPLLALGGLLWFMLPSGHDTVETVGTSQPSTQPVRPEGKVIALASVPDNWTSIGGVPNAYTNQDIYNRVGEKLGTIKDVLAGPDGKMTAAIVNVGRFLGIGEKDIALPLSALQVDQKDNSRRIVIDATKNTLQAAPAFEGRHAPTK